MAFFDAATNFVPDRWIALSSLQKSIRRGEVGHATAAGEVLWSEPSRLLDRILAIVLEDIGVFRVIDKQDKVTARPVAPQSIGSILRERAAVAGVATNHLSAHSLRSGFAVSAVRAGMSLPLIQAVTRHTTLDGLAPYVRTSGPPTNMQMADLISLDEKGIREWIEAGLKRRPKA